MLDFLARYTADPASPSRLNARPPELKVVIVVATADFEVYHGVVNELRNRGAEFTTVRPTDDIPDHASVVIAGPEDELSVEASVVTAHAGQPRQAVEAALELLRDGSGRTVVGVDPGDRPGIAVLSGDMVVAVFQVPLSEAAAVVQSEIEDAVEPVVRVGDGARLKGASLLDGLADVRVELVDETGTTPSLGTGTRGMGDVLAAVNIARLEGDVIESRDIEPTTGELQVIKAQSRRESPENREIDEVLARRVAAGDLTIEEALEEHRGE